MHNQQDLTNRIWEFVHGDTDAELDAHLQTCPECQAELSVLKGLAALKSVRTTPPIPESLTSSLTGLMAKVRPDLASAPQAAPSVAQRIRTIVADLLQDTALQPQVAGLRGDTRTRQIAFTSDVADLDLEVSPIEDQFLVVGQLGMDDVPQDLSIRFVPAESDPLSGDPQNANSTRLTEQGHFRLNVSPGNWVITVAIDDAVVVFPGIEL